MRIIPCSADAYRTDLGSRHNLVTLEKTDTESLTDNLFYQCRSAMYWRSPKDLRHSFWQIRLWSCHTASDRTNANGFFVNEQLDSYLDSISLYCTGGYSLTDAIAATGQNLEESPKVEAITFQKTGNSGNKTMFYWFQYMSYIFLMIFPLSLVPILVTFQQTDVSSRIACSACLRRRVPYSLVLAVSVTAFWHGLFSPLLLSCSSVRKMFFPNRDSCVS